jgi:hypothetical protein
MTNKSKRAPPEKMPPTSQTRDALISLARAAAAAHSLDPALVCAVVEQESAWNPFAIRYEPGFLARYVAPLFTAGKISSTEAYARSFSWGLMQVMGQVAREHEFSGASLAELCDPATGLDVGCAVLAHKFAAAGVNKSAADSHAVCPECSQSLPTGPNSLGAAVSSTATPGCAPSICADVPHALHTDPAVIARALQLWNGGANPDYAAQVLARLPRYASP